MPDHIGSHLNDPIGALPHPEEEIKTGTRYTYITRTNAYAFFESATHHERLISSPATWACRTTGMWVMGAVESTRGAVVDIVLNEMFCGNSINERYHITGMPIFTVTPMSELPVFLTTSYVVHEAGTTPSTTLDAVSLDDIISGRVT